MEQFTRFLQNEKHVSASTAKSYAEDVKRFASFFGKKVEKAKADDIRSYVKALQSGGKSGATVLRMLSSLHTYFSFLISEGRTKRDPTLEIERPKMQYKLPMILSVEETARLLAAPEGDSPIAVRDRAMLELLYATGITVSELCDLRIENINLRRRTLTMHHGERTRTVPFGKPASAAMNTYLKQARPLLFKGSGEVALFVSCNGTRMSRQGFWKLLKKYRQAAGIDKDITPHTLRHSFAAHLLENGADLSFIQEMMGFRDAASTAIYIEIIENKNQDIYNKAHPRAN